jgi:predicted DNA-binding transcriptional regulator AlpA
MSTQISGSGTPFAAITRSGQVSLSKWVNEKLPPWTELLTAHEVARLTRRHRWILSALTLLGRFPKQERFRGRAIGWKRHDVERWLRSDSGAVSAEFSQWPISSAHARTGCRTRDRGRSCMKGPANLARCSRRTRRRRWHRERSVAATVATELASVGDRAENTGSTLPLTFTDWSGQ